jgi:8-oxo-dGTP pyrophosphatase MutT (NUDIX family)
VTNRDDYRRLVPSWDVVEDGTLAKTRIFELKRRRATSPRSGRSGTFVYLDTPSWVNVVALTPNDEVVMIEQFRHGLGEVTLEIPGGIVDAGEAPEVAALRELAEETGYGGEGAEVIGVVSPNPAIQNNWCHTVLLHDAELRATPEPDENEEIAVRLVPLADLDDLVRNTTIHHAMVVCAFHHLRLRRARGRGQAKR